MTVPAEIVVIDQALYDFGGPPVPATDGAAAVDLVALAVYATRPDGKPDMDRRMPLDPSIPLHLGPGEMAYLCVGFRMRLMVAGFAAHLIPRSSSSALGIRLANTVGLVDEDYHNPLLVAVENRMGRITGQVPVVVSILRGERIAQLYLAPVFLPSWQVVDELGGTSGRTGGFGSTGRVQAG